jgi:hypothetical protein
MGEVGRIVDEFTRLQTDSLIDIRLLSIRKHKIDLPP